MGIDDSRHDEYGSAGGDTAIISLLACSLAGTEITLDVIPGTRLSTIYDDAARPIEQTTCNYGLNVALQDIASSAGMAVSATDATGEVRAVERPDHPFFVGTLYQPQLTSTPARPAPVFAAFVAAAAAYGAGAAV